MQLLLYEKFRLVLFFKWVIQQATVYSVDKQALVLLGGLMVRWR